jgi:hypothetical protein
MPENKLESVMRLEQDGTQVSGVMDAPGGGGVVSFRSTDGNLVDFSVETPAGKVSFHAKHQSSELAGTWQLPGFGQGKWNCRQTAD